MSHSHLVVNHVLRRAEEYRLRKSQQDVRPNWITKLIDDMAELFEPLEGVARVGFDCRLEEDGWSVGLFLGTNEIIGGPFDGYARQIDFQFDVLRALDVFTRVDRCYWDAYCDTHEQSESYQALVTIEGLVGDERVKLLVHSRPPLEIGPALREFPNGTTEAI